MFIYIKKPILTSQKLNIFLTKRCAGKVSSNIKIVPITAYKATVC